MGHGVLEHENILKFPVVAVRPKCQARRSLHQMNGHAQPVAFAQMASHAAGSKDSVRQ